MQLRTRGIVLQSTDYGESSLVVKIYTETSGMASFIVSSFNPLRLWS
jgi:recombinational DNA repair protein (RecF pathway)